jgi:hypothetical protein
MSQFVRPSFHNGQYRIAKQARPYVGARVAAWLKVAAVFPTDDSVVNYWALADALSELDGGKPSQAAHRFLRYCIERGWLERV